LFQNSSFIFILTGIYFVNTVWYGWRCNINLQSNQVTFPFRNFRCDCGNSRFANNKCNLEPVSRLLIYLMWTIVNTLCCSELTLCFTMFFLSSVRWFYPIFIISGWLIRLSSQHIILLILITVFITIPNW
jgi:hypothetical protein